MKTRAHTSRKERDLTVDGLEKHHNEATTLKARAKSTKAKIVAVAKTATKAKASKAVPEKRAPLAKTGRVATAGRVRK